MKRKRPVSPLYTFRVYPEGRYLYAEVNIWSTKRAMHDYKKVGRGYQAICTPLERISKDGRKLGQFCEINFYRNALGIGVVSHEMGHAAFCWAGRRRISIPRILKDNSRAYATMWERDERDSIVHPGAEESVVYILGELVRRTCIKLYALKLY